MGKEQILHVFKSYASGEIGISELEDWILSHLQGILHSGDATAEAMINEADSLLIEIGAGVINEEDLLNWVDGIISDSETVIATFTIGSVPETFFSDYKESPSGGTTGAEEEQAPFLVFA